MNVSVILQLMFEFFKTGLFSVGGGLATLPFLYEMSDKTGWFSHADIADMIAISESTPGAIGINMSTYAGYKTAGIPGGILASLSLAAPSVIIILIIAKFLKKFRENPNVEGAFYGLRPASIAMITAAGLNVAKVTLINIGAEGGQVEILQTCLYFGGNILACSDLCGAEEAEMESHRLSGDLGSGGCGI